MFLPVLTEDLSVFLEMSCAWGVFTAREAASPALALPTLLLHWEVDPLPSGLSPKLGFAESTLLFLLEKTVT